MKMAGDFSQSVEVLKHLSDEFKLRVHAFVASLGAGANAFVESFSLIRVGHHGLSGIAYILNAAIDRYRKDVEASRKKVIEGAHEEYVRSVELKDKKQNGKPSG